MNTRDLVGAFLIYESELLLTEGPRGLWSGVGGIIAPDEINSPIAACYREIEEKTGMTIDDIEMLELRYITTQEKDGIIEVIYYYIGTLSDKTDIEDNTFHWMKTRDTRDLPMSVPIKSILLHWLDNPKSTDVHLCVIDQNERVMWADL
ncbi:MAG: NUDIX domain-containing protein [Oscillospiraceae bacterium]|nr:NUDIX domain-containing protein [Oscillospiraceae bacterium]